MLEQYLLNEGLSADRVIKTGSPMKEILNHYASKIKKSNILKFLNIKPNDYLLVSAHREENIDSETNFSDFIETLIEIVKVYNKKVIVSAPRTMLKIKDRNKLNLNEHIIFSKPLGLFDYVFLQKNSYCVLSDSGTITEESSILNFPAIMIRYSHERPEGMDEGTLIMSYSEKR